MDLLRARHFHLIKRRCDVTVTVPFLPLQASKDALVASQGVPGSTDATPMLATFSDAILPKDWPLAFLAAPVLEEACVPPPFAWNALKLRSPPVLTTVLRHAQHLSRDAGQSVLASWPAQAMPPEVACGRVLEYLNAQASLPVHPWQLLAAL